MDKMTFIIGAAVLAIASVGCGDSASTGTESAATGEVAGSVAAEQAGPATQSSSARIVGIAFVDGSVTGRGSRATLPVGTTVHLTGSTITGREGCPTNRYGTDGLIVAVLDYTGRPTAASLTITEHKAGTTLSRAPYYLDLNTGRTLQFLGPIVQNGSYDLAFEYDLALGTPKTAAGQFTLARDCEPPS